MPLSDLIHRLSQMDTAEPGTVDALLGEAHVTEDCLAPYVNFSDEAYTRNRVHRDALFDVLVLCWRPGQLTDVHNHSGQHGWVRVLRGELEEEGFELDPDAPEAPAADPEDGVLMHVRLRPTTRASVGAGPTVVAVDPARNIHRISNPGRADAVSLHVYSRPHDSCLVYDLETGACRRKQLS